MIYRELKQKHRDELDNFKGIFHAFTDAQFEEGLKKLGLELEDAKEKVAQMYAGSSVLKNRRNAKGQYGQYGQYYVDEAIGSFILKNRRDAFDSMLNAHRTEKQELLKDEQFLSRALTYELCNHEYCYTSDTTDALEELGLKYNDVPKDIMIKATRQASKEG